MQKQKPRLKAKIKSLPKRPGVYLFKDTTGKVLYVGKALSLYDRVNSYTQKSLDAKSQRLLKLVFDLEFIETGSEFLALVLEARLIKQYRPRFNIAFKDDKSYLYIFISTGQEFPKVFTTRRPKKLSKSLGDNETYISMRGTFFGPFPSAKIVRQVLAGLRRIFPFCQQKRIGKRRCFYSHLHLCEPCPAMIITQDLETRRKLKRQYRYNIRQIARILKGDIGQVEQILVKEMNKLSNEQKFEAAIPIRRQLKQIAFMTQRKSVAAFLENPLFYYERQRQALIELQLLLKPYFPRLKLPKRIECFDISNTFGHGATGSQVVFVDGLPVKNEYKRYKITADNKPNDVKMIKEVILRRLKHREWTLPELVVVDGGKPQVSAGMAAIATSDLSIPIIGLAKRNEEVIVRYQDKFETVSAPRDCLSLKLLASIRDEAHRFALAYHRKRLRRELVRLSGSSHTN